MKVREKRLTIGSEIKAIMEKEGFSGYRVSKETGIDQTYISKIMRNRINPSYLTLKRILNVLGYQICFEKIPHEKEVKVRRVYKKKPKGKEVS